MMAEPLEFHRVGRGVVEGTRFDLDEIDNVTFALDTAIRIIFVSSKVNGLCHTHLVPEEARGSNGFLAFRNRHVDGGRSDSQASIRSEYQTSCEETLPQASLSMVSISVSLVFHVRKCLDHDGMKIAQEIVKTSWNSSSWRNGERHWWCLR